MSGPDSSLTSLLLPAAGGPLVSGSVDVPAFAWGFGGMHGGLVLSLVAREMQRLVPDHPLRSVTAQFLRPVRDSFSVEADVLHSGRSSGVVQARVSCAGNTCIIATAVLGSDQPGAVPEFIPTMPQVPRPDSLARLRALDDKIPVLAGVDVRPVTAVEPYGRASEPAMTAWMRLPDRDLPIDPIAGIFFLDALPPSLTAVLHEHRPVPTLELSAHLGANVPVSPWLLVSARTTGATPGGWVTERLDLWDQDGSHVASCQQLRLAAAIRKGSG